MNIGIRAIPDWSFKDYTSGFIAVRKDVFKHIKLKDDYGEYFIDMIYRMILLHYKIIELSYICLPRERGYSKTGSNLKDYIKLGSKYVVVTLGLLPLKIKYKLFRIAPK